MAAQDLAELPFSDLDRTQVLHELGSRWAYYLGNEGIACIGKSNYIANYFQTKLRVHTKEVERSHAKLYNPAAILNLPVELVCEIFGHLHPLDLYNLIRTSKAIRGLLLNRGSEPVWKSSYNRSHDKSGQANPLNLSCPPCPQDVSYPKWTSLLFGPATCDLCPCYPAMVDFTYRLRLCKNCTETYTLPEVEASIAYDVTLRHPWESQRFWKMVRYTYRTNHVMYPSVYDNERSPRYARADVQARTAEMNRYHEAIDEGQPDARERYEEFVSYTTHMTREYVKLAKACHSWCLTIWNIEKVHFDHVFESQVVQTCVMHLVNDLGHHVLDVPVVIPYLRSYFTEKLHPRFSKKEIEHLAPVLVEKFVLEAKKKRLAEERQALLKLREATVGAFYRDVVRPLLPPLLWDLPQPPAILELPTILEYVNSEGMSVDAIPKDRVLPEIMECISGSVHLQKQQLVDLMLTALPELEEQLKGLGLGVLDLAMALFKPDGDSMRGKQLLFGWDEAKFEVYGGGGKLVFDTKAFENLRAMLRSVGLDPISTTAKTISEMNKRFVCIHCWEAAMRATPRGDVVALEWRDCAGHHYLENGKRRCGNAHGPTEPSSFFLLGEDIVASVVCHESTYPSPFIGRWSCMLCAEHAKNPVRRKLAVAHVKQKHSISEPVEGRDLFYRMQYREIWYEVGRKRQLIKLDEENSNLACLLCRGPSALHLWERAGLWTHLASRHSVQEPEENVHFRRRLLRHFIAPTPGQPAGIIFTDQNTDAV
ncbi:hypothetical protein D9613_008772 [Agrocybe pediades]|uniref:F-box domain-containing protein n=1 Tax=Agrocybe pediades TaxID=84607 RepID=A0A8H4QTC5_9AGAR|nr:hypothetical protein D9613_008772 [Agrocybe pediades]